MRGTYRVSVVAFLLALVSGGCASSGQARYVYQDGQYGVVGIPENTDHWPSHYRDKAEALMEKHFPEGYEIVRAEEVEEGSRTLTVNGTNSAELEAGSVLPLMKLGKLGRTATRTQADRVKIKECRILYKKAGSCDEGSEIEHGYAERPSLSPETYVDPNADARHHVVARPKLEDPEKVADAHKSEKSHDPGAAEKSDAKHESGTAAAPEK